MKMNDMIQQMMFGNEAPMPTARHGLGVATYDGTIYKIGGGPTPRLTTCANYEIFQPNNQIFER
ncbi:hypothetical protein [Candidatus Nitrosocosmicus hydrocola]|jgi:hypothetical protein|uniref:hypothetical protein n=1 Tax=Candidatus Nitrosocosmicus hydrocola TaxID=1826872 RepID=UPI000AD84562|nr:hypothetical protein [Candidatus Nitrosocosmicus hydrocola]